MTESTQLPTLDELRETTTFHDMAEWLTACPLALFMTHGHEIRAICEECGFMLAVAYVDAVVRTVHAVRMPDRNNFFVRSLFDVGLLKDKMPGWREPDAPADGGKADRQSGDCEALSGASGESRDSARAGH